MLNFKKHNKVMSNFPTGGLNIFSQKKPTFCYCFTGPFVVDKN